MQIASPNRCLRHGLRRRFRTSGFRRLLEFAA
jgi:hypothetical protein